MGSAGANADSEDRSGCSPLHHGAMQPGGHLAVLVGGRGGYPLGQIARPNDVHSHR